MLVLLALVLAHRSARADVGRWSLPLLGLVLAALLATGALNLLLLHPRTGPTAAAVLVRLAALGAALAVALVAGEVAVRALPQPRADEPPVPPPSSSEPLFDPDPVLHHVLRRSLRTCYAAPEFDVEVETNAAGFRDRERAGARAPGSCRIAVVGDSYVAGLEVAAERSWTVLLERRLQAELGDPALEVLNFGVPAYSPAVEAPLVRDVVLAYAPDVVILSLFPNDVFDDAYFTARARLDVDGEVVAEGLDDTRGLARLAEALEIGLRKRSALFRRAEEALRRWRVAHRAAYGLAPIFAERWSRADVAAVEATLGHVERTRRLVESAGARFLVLTIPFGNQVSADEWDLGKVRFGLAPAAVGGDHFQRFARGWLGARDVAYLDLLPDLVRSEGGARLYQRRDTHLTPAGHRAVAEAMARHLASDQAWLLEPCRGGRGAAGAGPRSADP